MTGQEDPEETPYELQSQSTQMTEKPQSVSSLSWEIGIIVVAAYIFLKWIKRKLDDD